MSALPVSTRRSVWLLSLATFSSMAAQRVCDAMLPELARVFSVGLGQAAQVVSLFAVVYGLSQLFYGPLGDRLGKLRVISLATLGCSLGNLAALFVTSLDALVLARMAVALGAAAIIPLSLAWIGDSVGYDRLQETLARVGLGTTLGLVGGQLVGGLMTDTLGWRWAFALLTLLFGVVGTLLLVDAHRQPGPAVPAPAGGVQPRFAAQALRIVGGRWPRVVLVTALLEGAVGFGVVAMWASHLHGRLALPLSTAGAIVALYGAGGVAYMAGARGLIHRFGERGLALLGASCFGAGALVLAFAPHWAMAVPASLVAGFGFFMFHNTLQTNATLISPGARGTGVSMFALALFTGQSLGAQLSASVIGWLGSTQVVALGAGALFALGAVFAWLLPQREAWMAAH